MNPIGGILPQDDPAGASVNLDREWWTTVHDTGDYQLAARAIEGGTELVSTDGNRTARVWLSAAECDALAAHLAAEQVVEP